MSTALQATLASLKKRAEATSEAIKLQLLTSTPPRETLSGVRTSTIGDDDGGKTTLTATPTAKQAVKKIDTVGLLAEKSNETGKRAEPARLSVMAATHMGIPGDAGDLVAGLGSARSNASPPGSPILCNKGHLEAAIDAGDPGKPVKAVKELTLSPAPKIPSFVLHTPLAAQRPPWLSDVSKPRADTDLINTILEHGDPQGAGSQGSSLFVGSAGKIATLNQLFVGSQSAGKTATLNQLKHATGADDPLFAKMGTPGNCFRCKFGRPRGPSRRCVRPGSSAAGSPEGRCLTVLKPGWTLARPRVMQAAFQSGGV